MKRVGRELGVRYVLEGSVRKAGNRVRIAGQLIDTATSRSLWADRFDGELEDVFRLQDQVTSSVVGAIGPKLEQVEIDRAKRKPTESLSAYDHYLQGIAKLHQPSPDAVNEALHLFYRAIELDPEFASAYGRAESTSCACSSMGCRASRSASNSLWPSKGASTSALLRPNTVWRDRARCPWS